MTEPRDREQALNEFWNAVVAGSPQPGAPELDDGDREAILALHRAATGFAGGTSADAAWPRVLARIAKSPARTRPRPVPHDPVPPAPLTTANGHVPAIGRRPPRRTGWTSGMNFLATAALLLLTLAAGLVAYGPLRPPADDRAPGLPTLIGVTSPAQGVVGEVPLDLSLGPLPAGPRQLLAGEVRLQPGVVMSEPPLSGLVLLNVEQGTIAVLLPDGETPLRAGDRTTVPVNGEFSIRNDGDDEAIFLQAFVLDAASTGGREHNTAAHYSVPGGGAGHWPIAVGADLPAGSGWLTLERVTLEPGAALPPFVATGLDWIAPFSGRVGITLEGDRLPFRWDSGDERTFAAHDRVFPRFTPGTKVTLRNASDTELVLLRLAVASLPAP